MDADGEKILALLKQKGGSLPLGDKSSPEEIKEALGMSKGEFKRAIGRLYKKQIIKIAPERISLV